MSGNRHESGPKRRKRGFERASQLVAGRVRDAGEARGFAVTRLLTHWTEIVGADVAAASRPVEISYGRGFGATLTMLTTGAHAPLLEMQKEVIRERVNACYGYAAIQRIRITQTAPGGFSEGRSIFERGSHEKTDWQEPATPDAVSTAASGVQDGNLRKALERLGTNVLFRSKQ